MIKSKFNKRILFLCIVAIGLALLCHLNDPTDNSLPVGSIDLKSHEKIVYHFNELKDALEKDNGITTVYLGDHIIMQTSGISIYTGKDDIIIDGINPEDENQLIHTLTDVDSTAQTQTIFVASTASMTNITIRNMNVIGQNYFGFVSISGLKSGVTITYENITYSGPQMTYNILGTARYIDCNISINSNNKGPNAQEVAEIKNVEIGGTTVIHHQAITYMAFLLSVQSGYFKVLENSRFIINVENTDPFFVSGGATVDFSIEKDGYFHCTSPTGLAYLTQNLNHFIIKENGQFYLETKKAQTTYAVIRLTGNLTVENNAIFHVKSSVNTGRLVVFTNANAKAIFNTPKSVLLYSPNNHPLYWLVNYGSLSITSKQINYWKIAGTGDFDDIPDYSWIHDDNVVISANVSVSGVISNLTTNDTTDSLTAANLHLANCRVLAFGDFDLMVDDVYKDSQSISGNTEPHAFIKASYKTTQLYNTSNVSGYFSLDATTPLADIEYVTVMAKYAFLAKQVIIEVLENDHHLLIDIPSTISFETTLISPFKKTVYRENPDWMITLLDTRGIGSQWELYAQVIQPFTSQNNEVLHQALVYVDGNNKIHNLEIKTLIFHNIARENIEGTYLTWDKTKGILAIIPPGEAMVTTYSAVIQWDLVSGP